MAKVKLLKKVGKHQKGAEIEVKDASVLSKWESLGVIAKSKAAKEEKETKDK